MLKKVALFLLVGFIGVSAVGLWLSFTYPPESTTVADDVSPVTTQDTTVTTPPVTQVTSYSATEVAKHATAQDCWLIVRENVYDVDSFIATHPGGAEALTNQCGREVSDLFASIHSNRAWDLLGSFKIGELI